jgi:hypothetical protein
MSEALPENPSIEQIASNIRLAELLASGGGADLSSLSTTHQSQEGQLHVTHFILQ